MLATKAGNGHETKNMGQKVDVCQPLYFWQTCAKFSL
jgi:hypothetical protein